jgi:hypothetical protein
MKNSNNSRLVETILLAIGIFCSSISWGQGFPEGEHLDKVIASCTACHGLDKIVNPSNKMSAEDWEFYVYDMISRGAPVRKEDMEDIVKYLVDNFTTR